jgi:hypothetical protein
LSPFDSRAKLSATDLNNFAFNRKAPKALSELTTKQLSEITERRCLTFSLKFRTGVDIMITIFCDFRQFSAKKLALFLKNQCYDQTFA